MAASSGSGLRMALKRSSSIISTTLKTKKTIETNEAIELSLSSSAVNSAQKIGERLNPFIRSYPFFKSKAPSPSPEDWAKAAEIVKKYIAKRRHSVLFAAFVAAAIGRTGGIVKEEAFTASYSVKTASDNRRQFTRTTDPMEETSSDFTNYNPDSVEELLDTMKWGEKGVVVAIFQDTDTGKILKQRPVNREDLATAISSGKATFDDPSLSLLTNGQISSNFNIHDINLSCNRDSLIFIGKPDGPTCHTCSETCYHNSVLDYLNNHRAAQNRPPLTTLYSLEAMITRLQLAKVETVVNGTPALTKQLMLNPMLLCSKIREEVKELCLTLRDDEERSQRWQMFSIMPWYC